MSVEELWNSFTDKTGVTAEYEAWAFGADADSLAHLVYPA